MKQFQSIDSQKIKETAEEKVKESEGKKARRLERVKELAEGEKARVLKLAKRMSEADAKRFEEVKQLSKRQPKRVNAVIPVEEGTPVEAAIVVFVEAAQELLEGEVS